MAFLNDCGTSRGSLALGISHHIRPTAVSIRYKTKCSNAMRMMNLIQDAKILLLLGALLHKCYCSLFGGCKKTGPFVNWACLSPPKRTLSHREPVMPKIASCIFGRSIAPTSQKGKKVEARREKAKKGKKVEARRERATPLPTCVSLFAFHLLPLTSPLFPLVLLNCGSSPLTHNKGVCNAPHRQDSG